MCPLSQSGNWNWSSEDAEHFHQHKGLASGPFIATPTCCLRTWLLSWTPGNHQFVLHFCNFVLSRILHKCNHIICNLWDWLWSFSIFLWRFIEVDGYMNRCFSFLLLSSIPWYWYITAFFFFFFFWCGPLFFFKSLLNLLQNCFCFMFQSFWPLGMWDLSSLTRDRNCTPCIGRLSLNHWTAREVPITAFLLFILLLKMVVSSLGLLWIKMLWTFVYTFLYIKCKSSFLWDKWPRKELLGCMVVACNTYFHFYRYNHKVTPQCWKLYRKGFCKLNVHKLNLIFNILVWLCTLKNEEWRTMSTLGIFIPQLLAP